MNYLMLKGPSLDGIKELLEKDVLVPRVDGFASNVEVGGFDSTDAIAFEGQLRFSGQFNHSGIQFDVLVKRGSLEAVMLNKFISRNIDSFEYQFQLSSYQLDEAV